MMELIVQQIPFCFSTKSLMYVLFCVQEREERTDDVVSLFDILSNLYMCLNSATEPSACERLAEKALKLLQVRTRVRRSES